MKTPLCDRLGCAHPILQAGMGGVARSELVSAVCNAGGYGFLGMVRESPDLIRSQIRAVRAATDNPYGVNLIPAATDAQLFDAELSVCLDEDIHSLCFFWDVDRSAVRRAKQAGKFVFHQVGSVESALTAADAGADAIIIQGVEAGGHVMGCVTSIVLIPQVVKAVAIPVIASGGFASGHGLLAALALGCEAIHCGTAFLATRESFAHDYHKDRVISAESADTVHTDGFAINWPASSPVRVIRNTTVEKFGDKLMGHLPHDFATETIAHEDGRPIYRHSTDSPLRSTSGQLEELALFAGQVCGQIENLPAAGELVSRIITEANVAMETLVKHAGRQ